MNIRYGALFDLDGVLIDSEKHYTLFWQEMERLYPTNIPNYAYAIKGTTLEKILLNYESEEVKRDLVSRLQEFQNVLPYELYPGAMNFLIELQEAGIPRALVTSSDHRKMEKLFARIPELEQMFDYIIDGSMVTRSKPDPEGYLKAAERIGIDSEYCCVFEDSLQGLKAGRAAGGKVVGVATTYDYATVAPHADITVHTIADMDIERFVALWK